QDGHRGRSEVEIDTGCGEVLFVDWPVGTPHTPDVESHWFLRDRYNNFPPGQLDGETDLHTTLPPDARDTGLRRGTWQLWLSPSKPGAWLRSADVTERWSYVAQQFGCA